MPATRGEPGLWKWHPRHFSLWASSLWHASICNIPSTLFIQVSSPSPLILPDSHCKKKVFHDAAGPQNSSFSRRSFAPPRWLSNIMDLEMRSLSRSQHPTYLIVLGNFSLVFHVNFHSKLFLQGGVVILSLKVMPGIINVAFNIMTYETCLLWLSFQSSHSSSTMSKKDTAQTPEIK